MFPITKEGNDQLAQLIREVSERMNNTVTGTQELVKPLREHVEPMCHVGRGDEMDGSEEGFRLQLEWYAGQILSMVDNEQWLGINSWINCTEKFTTRKEEKLMNTMQQEFDAVVAHLYKQGRPAKAKERGATGGSCKYRYDDGGTTLMCAVGCRIPDDKYDPRMDTMSDTDILSIVDVFADVLPPEISEYKEMFAELQDAHDFHHESGFDFGTLEIDLNRIARDFGLTFTKPEGY